MIFGAVGLKTHIWGNHAKSALLLMGFPFLLLLMTAAFFAGAEALKLKSLGHWPELGNQLVIMAAKDGVARHGYIAALVAGGWFVIAYFLNGWMIRAATGAQPITRAQMPRIYNMLENLCISRGLPMPAFEVIDSPALNAFASGIDQKSYRIVLTRGLIDKLSDDELEAVIAHELTHIINRDVQLLIIAVIFVGMISFFCEMGFRLLRHGFRHSFYGRNDKGKGGVMLLLLLATVILAVGYVFAIVIRFALSRRREYLADAGAVELTKNPEAMMRALLRISGRDRIAGMPDEVQQMCIENSHEFLGVFATHPSIDDRVKALSEMTRTPVPALGPDTGVSLRRTPKRPWENSRPPDVWA